MCLQHIIHQCNKLILFFLGSCQSIQSKGMASTEKLTATLDDTHGELWDCMVKLCPINTKKWPQLIWYKRLIALTKVSY